MKRLILIATGALGASVGVFLVLNWIDGDLEVAGKTIQSAAFTFCLNWGLRILFLGGGFTLIAIGFFGSDATVSKAMRGFKDAL